MKKNLCLLAVLAVMVFGMAITAAAEEGVTDTEIHIGEWGPQTGPVAAWGSVARGTAAYCKMINAQGGIHGRKLIHHLFDDQYNPAKTRAGVKELQEGTGIFAWTSGVGTAPGLAVRAPRLFSPSLVSHGRTPRCLLAAVVVEPYIVRYRLLAYLGPRCPYVP